MATTAAIYVRLSIETDSSTSPARQREACELFAKARGWTVTGVFEDVDVSASKSRLSRPGLDALRASGADVWLVWKLDRLARRVLDLAQLVDEAEASGAAIVSATEPFDLTTPIGRSMAQLLGVFAELEAATIGQRVRSSIAKLKREHRWPGGRVPYGYRVVDRPDGPGRMLVPEEEAASVVVELADRVVSGESLYSIARDVNQRGLRTALGGLWTIQSLRHVLTSDSVLGRVRDRGELLRGPDGLPLSVWEPLLPLTVVERLRELLAQSPGEPGRKKASRVLSGLLECQSCGGGMVVGGKSSTRPQYRCASHTRTNSCQGPAYIGALALEELVEAELLARLGDWQLVELVPARRDSEDRAAVEEAIRETATQLARSATPELVDRLRELQLRRDALEESVPAADVRKTGRTYAEEWQLRDLAGRRELLAGELAGRIVIARGRGMVAERAAIPWR